MGPTAGPRYFDRRASTMNGELFSLSLSDRQAHSRATRFFLLFQLICDGKPPQNVQISIIIGPPAVSSRAHLIGRMGPKGQGQAVRRRFRLTAAADPEGGPVGRCPVAARRPPTPPRTRLGSQGERGGSHGCRTSLLDHRCTDLRPLPLHSPCPGSDLIPHCSRYPSSCVRHRVECDAWCQHALSVEQRAPRKPQSAVTGLA